MTVPAFTLSIDELRQMLREEIRAELGSLAPATGPASLSLTTYYTVPEFAALVGVGTPAIYRDAKAGKLPHIRVGTSIRICETALNSYAQVVGA